MKIKNEFSDKELLIGFSLVDGIGNGTLRKMISKKDIGSKSSFLTKDQKILASVIDWEEVRSSINRWRKNGIEIVTILDKNYPARLKEIPDYPPVLYLKGNKSLMYEVCFAVVGTRKVSDYGRRCVDRFVSDFVDKNWCIVSGMAFGVDSSSHWATIRNSGKTIAVLASGVDIPSPATNKNLYDKILEGGGLIVSEYPPETKPFAGFFPARNRIISGLSIGTLIVEAGDRSGSLITANCAFEQNREVFAIPGDIGRKSSFGTNKIIKEGLAKLVVSSEDIFSEYGYINDVSFDSVSFDSDEERAIYNLLFTEGGLRVDEMSAKLGLTPSFISGILTMMELKGMLTSIDSKYRVSL